MYRKVILALFVMFFLFLGKVFGQSREEDSLALVDLYNSTDGGSWSNNTNWLDGPIDDWYGVTVSGDRVTHLVLSYNNLTGSIPSSIGNLTGLSSLDLHGNNLTGSIPSSIGSLTSLRTLDLLDNDLTGSVPSSIGSLTSLSSLDLSGNNLTSSIPSSIGNLTGLKQLHLYDNQLTGSIPSEIENLTSLQYLGLNNNKFNGVVPSGIADLSSLLLLRLNDNDFVDLPSLSELSSLNSLKIQNNKFTFEDIEPNIDIPNFDYSPQDSVGSVQNETVTEGSDLTISVSVGGEYNEYQWEKDGSVISGATNDSYTITSAEMSDAGSYTCEITNTVATALTLYSRPVNVTVNPPPPEEITITSPNGGEDWKVDSTYNITWTSNGTTGNVKIAYSTNNGSSWTEEVASTTDDGSYSWTIPDTPSDSCMVRISDTDGSPSDVSNSTFTISVTPYITVTSPNGGEDWKVDSTYDISWTSNSTSGEVEIEYSTDNGSVWTEVITSMPDTGIYSWIIPDIPSDSCMVRISDTEGDPTDVSDSVFAISASSAVPLEKLPKVYSMSVKTITAKGNIELTYTLPKQSNIKFSIYDITGKRVKELSKEEQPGRYSEKIDMPGLSTGVYFIIMEANGKEFSKKDKVLLVK